jgi:hypothetical protein
MKLRISALFFCLQLAVERSAAERLTASCKQKKSAEILSFMRKYHSPLSPLAGGPGGAFRR